MYERARAYAYLHLYTRTCAKSLLIIDSPNGGDMDGKRYRNVSQ